MSLATHQRRNILDPRHEWHAAFKRHCRRQGIADAEIDAVVVEEFIRYFESKTAAGRRAEIKDCNPEIVT